MPNDPDPTKSTSDPRMSASVAQPDGTSGPSDTNRSSTLDPATAIRIDAGGWGLTWTVRADGQLAQVGLGPDGHRADIDASILGLYPLAYRTWGAGDAFHEAALRVIHADGSLVTRLRATAVEHRPDGAGEHITVTCTDESHDLTVEHHFRTNPASSVLEQWVEVEQHESGPIRLGDYDSLCHFMVVMADAKVCQFGGAGWADEWHWTTEDIHPGIRVLSSMGGVQPHLQRSPMLIVHPEGLGGAESARAEPGGTQPGSTDIGGEPVVTHLGSGNPEVDTPTIGLSIAWGGNTRFHLAARPTNESDGSYRLVLKAGANPYGADYVLDPGVRFVTPTVAWTWADGRDQMTERFHRWTVDRVLRDPERLRPIVSNNWEATGFDFDEQRITELITMSADLGAEVFLLDDGWFGSDFPRNDDTQGLGDWEVDTNKLPNGLAALVAAAEESDIRMGIWVEPEMVNPRSNLYAQHPDWAPAETGEPGDHRWQLYLDPLIEEVRDFEVGVVDSTLASAPGISYVKWDANRLISQPDTTALPPDRRSNLFVDGVHATWEVMDRVATGHPDVELMLCASGGGRNDHGSLRFFHEFWTSDNTDPVTRISMQWAASHFFPASVVAAHVTAWGQRPLGFACAVALSARFGLDLDLAPLSAEDRETLRSAISLAKRTRHLVQRGRLIRMVSPIGDTPGVPAGERAALCYRGTEVSGGEDEAVVFRYRIEGGAGSAHGDRDNSGVLGSGSGSTDEGADADVPGWRSDRLDWIDPDVRYIVWYTAFGQGADAAPTEFLSGAELRNRIDTTELAGPLTADVFEIRAT